MLSLSEDLQSGALVMTREIMIQLIESTDRVRMEAFGWTAWEMHEIDERWLTDWVQRAKPEWLDVLAELLANPPLTLKPYKDDRFGGRDDWIFTLHFKRLFQGIAIRFPSKGLRTVGTLIQNESNYPLLIDLLFVE